MNQEFQFRLQAYLDGELPPAEAAEVAGILGRDAEAAALLGELQIVKSALAGNEAELKLPETREFHWSKIQREIERQTAAAEKAPARKLSLAEWFQRHVLQVGGLALVSCIIGIMALQSHGAVAQAGEVEVASDQMGAYTFRDQQEGMTMVWLYNHNDDSQFTDDSSLASMDTE